MQNDDIFVSELLQKRTDRASKSELVGFHSENHFRKVFSGLTGTTPLKFRKSKQYLSYTCDL